MNQDDANMMQALAQKVEAGTLAASTALKTAYALGTAREITDHARQDSWPTKEVK